MNDETLLARIERATSPGMATPLEAVVARGRQIRRRRWTHVALASTAAVLLAVGIVVGPTSGASTAWAVDRTWPDMVTVTIKSLEDPSGLQSALHARRGVGNGDLRHRPLRLRPDVGTIHRETLHPAGRGSGRSGRRGHPPRRVAGRHQPRDLDRHKRSQDRWTADADDPGRRRHHRVCITPGPKHS
jgi:hypothetical protein